MRRWPIVLLVLVACSAPERGPSERVAATTAAPANASISPDATPVPASATAKARATAAPVQARAPRQQATAVPAAACVQRPGVEETPATTTTTAEPGRYTYAVDGTFDLDAKRDREGKLPPRAVRVRGAPEAQPTGTRYTEQRVQGEEGSTTSHLLLTATDVKLEKTVTKNRRGEREFNPVPPLTMMRFPLAPDLEWESTATDGSATVTLKGKVLRTDTIEICGSRYGVWVIDTRITIVAPQAQNETHAVSWIATALGNLTLREDGDTKTSAQGNELRTKSKSVLRSVAPG